MYWRSVLGLRVKSGKAPSQGSAERMRAVPKTLRENSSCGLSGGLGAKVFLGEDGRNMSQTVKEP